MQNAEVDFCGYSVPHPSEPKMNLRLQTTGGQWMRVFSSPFSSPTSSTARKVAPAHATQEIVFTKNGVRRHVATLCAMGEVPLSITEVGDGHVRALPFVFVLESFA